MRFKTFGGVATTALAALVLATVGLSGSSAGASARATLSARLASATLVAQQGTGTGYWVVSADGTVYAFGTAVLYGSMHGKHLNAPIVDIVATSDGHGYWLVAKDGAVFSYGDAGFVGSLGGRILSAPAVGMASSDGNLSTTGPRGATGMTGRTGATGQTGLTGAAGHAGLTGAAGSIGATGAAGGIGATGAAGGIGAAGSIGATGAQGSIGAAGSIGATGAAGSTGAAGTIGATGAAGSIGATGAQGATGLTGPAATPNYAYIYNLTAQTVAIEGAVTFDSNGPVAGFGHAPGTSTISVTAAGIYVVDFSTSGTEASQFALTVNGAAVPQSTYGSGAGTQQNNGQTILALGAGDILDLRNHSSAAAVGLPSVMGGTQANVNASLLIEQLR